jgi:anti-sigma-K factor RskA
VTARQPETLHLAEASVHEGPGYAVGAPQPRIIAYDAAEPGFDDEAPASVDKEPQAGQGRSSLGLLAAAAIAALLLAAAAFGAWAVWGDDGGSSASAPAGAVEALDLISQPGAQRVAVAGSKETMVLVVTPGGKAALIISGLKSAPKGKEYQAWIVAGGKPHSAGLFKGGQTRLVIPLAQKIPKGAIFAVTLEKAGGVPAPTQSPQYTAKLS